MSDADDSDKRERGGRGGEFKPDLIFPLSHPGLISQCRFDSIGVATGGSGPEQTQGPPTESIARHHQRADGFVCTVNLVVVVTYARLSGARPRSDGGPGFSSTH